MIPYITEKTATFVTNAVSHALELAERGFHVIILGGELKAATVEVKPDTTVDVYVGGFEEQNRISLNGDLVLAGAGTYALKVTGNAAIAFDKKTNNSGSWYICDITMG